MKIRLLFNERKLKTSVVVCIWKSKIKATKHRVAAKKSNLNQTAGRSSRRSGQLPEGSNEWWINQGYVKQLSVLLSVWNSSSNTEIVKCVPTAQPHHDRYCWGRASCKIVACMTTVLSVTPISSMMTTQPWRRLSCMEKSYKKNRRNYNLSKAYCTANGRPLSNCWRTLSYSQTFSTFNLGNRFPYK